MIQRQQRAGFGVLRRSAAPQAILHERSVIQCTLLYPAMALLLVVLLLQVTGRQIARAEEALERYRQEATEYRQTAETYQATAQAMKREETQGQRKALRALLEQQAAGYPYD